MAAGAWACAGQAPPPGGPEDHRPPVVVATEPAPFAESPGFRGPVRLRFNERISERTSGGSLDDAVVVSPRTGAVSVHHERRALTVSVEGGFQPGLVYRVTLMPVVSDMFGNQLVDPFELVFTTGGTPTTDAVAGRVWDRITGRGVAGAQVLAHREGGEAAPNVAVADRQGIYALRYLPPGAYRLTAFEDANRDGEPNGAETRGAEDFTVAEGDTLVLDVPVLAPDSTPASVSGVTVVDSVTLLVEMDDYLDTTLPITSVALLLERDDGGPAPPVDSLFHEFEYTRWVGVMRDSLNRLDSLDAARAREAASPDTSAAADTLAVADTLGPPPVVDTSAVAPAADTGAAGAPTRRPPTALPGARAGRGAQPTGPRGRPLPSRRIVARLRGPLERDVQYRVIVTGVINLNLIPEGGGLDSLRFAPAVADSAGGRGRGGGRRGGPRR